MHMKPADGVILNLASFQTTKKGTTHLRAIAR